MSARPDNPSVDAGLSRAWYAAQIGGFLNSEPIAVIGHLAANGNLTLVPEQKDAWLAQIEFLQAQLPGFSGSLFLEFNIPRMGRRIDAVLVISGILFVIEFKVGKEAFDRAALDQVLDYALDQKNLFGRVVRRSRGAASICRFSSASTTVGRRLQNASHSPAE